MKYYLLPKERWEEARPILESFGQELPSPEISLLSVAEDDAGQLCGMLCFHPVLHGEPMWVSEEKRGQVDVLKLQKSLTDVLPKGTQYYAFTPSRKMRWIAGTCGMKPLPWDVWKGQV